MSSIGKEPRFTEIGFFGSSLSLCQLLICQRKLCRTIAYTQLEGLVGLAQ